MIVHDVERDWLLRRVERDAVISCAVMAVAAALLWRSAGAGAGVVGGGALAWISYRGVKGGIDALVDAANPPSAAGKTRPASAWGLVKFFTRYAILAAVAYVIMARLRLPPVAVVAGASSIVIAIAIEAVRSFRDHPRHQWRS